MILKWFILALVCFGKRSSINNLADKSLYPKIIK